MLETRTKIKYKSVLQYEMKVVSYLFSIVCSMYSTKLKREMYITQRV